MYYVTCISLRRADNTPDRLKKEKDLKRMIRFALKYFVELTGNPVSSSMLKKFTSSRVSKPLIRPFSKSFQINEKEMDRPLHQYDSLQDFFTRKLKDGIRPINPEPSTLVSPVDGVLSCAGKIVDNQTFYIKDHLYSLPEILGSEKKAATYKNGYYYVLYLSPRHYHRIHYPITGTLASRYALGEKSFPVNNFGMTYGDKPFSTNYRLISELSTRYGNVAVVKVGALNINSIQLLHAENDCNKGEELGYFTFGSTVLLFIEEHASFTPCIHENKEVQVGQTIGKWEDR